MRRLAVVAALLLIVGCQSADVDVGGSSEQSTILPVFPQAAPTGPAAPLTPPGVFLFAEDVRLRLYAGGAWTELEPPGLLIRPEGATLAADGTTVVAVVLADGAHQVWVRPLTGGNARLVPLPSPVGIDLAWSEAGNLLAYVPEADAVLNPDSFIVFDVTGEAQFFTLSEQRITGLAWGHGEQLVIFAVPAERETAAASAASGATAVNVWLWSPAHGPALVGREIELGAQFARPTEADDIVYVPGSGSDVRRLTRAGEEEVLFTPERVRTRLPGLTPGAGPLFVRRAQLDAAGERLAVLVHTADDESRWVVLLGSGGEEPVVWTAPPPPCFVTDLAWSAVGELLVQTAGAACSSVVVLAGEMGVAERSFPVPVKGVIQPAPDSAWLAVHVPGSKPDFLFVQTQQPAQRVAWQPPGPFSWCCTARDVH